MVAQEGQGVGGSLTVSLRCVEGAFGGLDSKFFCRLSLICGTVEISKDTSLASIRQEKSGRVTLNWDDASFEFILPVTAAPVEIEVTVWEACSPPRMSAGGDFALQLDVRDIGKTVPNNVPLWDEDAQVGEASLTAHYASEMEREDATKTQVDSQSHDVIDSVVAGSLSSSSTSVDMAAIASNSSTSSNIRANSLGSSLEINKFEGDDHHSSSFEAFVEAEAHESTEVGGTNSKVAHSAVPVADEEILPLALELVPSGFDAILVHVISIHCAHASTSRHGKLSRRGAAAVCALEEIYVRASLQPGGTHICRSPRLAMPIRSLDDTQPFVFTAGEEEEICLATLKLPIGAAASSTLSQGKASIRLELTGWGKTCRASLPLASLLLNLVEGPHLLTCSVPLLSREGSNQLGTADIAISLSNMHSSTSARMLAPTKVKQFGHEGNEDGAFVTLRLEGYRGISAASETRLTASLSMSGTRASTTLLQDGEVILKSHAASLDALYLSLHHSGQECELILPLPWTYSAFQEDGPAKWVFMPCPTDFSVWLKLHISVAKLSSKSDYRHTKFSIAAQPPPFPTEHIMRVDTREISHSKRHCSHEIAHSRCAIDTSPGVMEFCFLSGANENEREEVNIVVQYGPSSSDKQSFSGLPANCSSPTHVVCKGETTIHWSINERWAPFLAISWGTEKSRETFVDLAPFMQAPGQRAHCVIAMGENVGHLLARFSTLKVRRSSSFVPLIDEDGPSLPSSGGISNSIALHVHISDIRRLHNDVMRISAPRLQVMQAWTSDTFSATVGEMHTPNDDDWWQLSAVLKCTMVSPELSPAAEVILFDGTDPLAHVILPAFTDVISLGHLRESWLPMRLLKGDHRAKMCELRVSMQVIGEALPQKQRQLPQAAPALAVRVKEARGLTHPHLPGRKDPFVTLRVLDSHFHEKSDSPVYVQSSLPLETQSPSLGLRADSCPVWECQLDVPLPHAYIDMKQEPTDGRPRLVLEALILSAARLGSDGAPTEIGRARIPLQWALICSKEESSGFTGWFTLRNEEGRVCGRLNMGIGRRLEPEGHPPSAGFLRLEYGAGSNEHQDENLTVTILRRAMKKEDEDQQVHDMTFTGSPTWFPLPAQVPGNASSLFISCSSKSIQGSLGGELLLDAAMSTPGRSVQEMVAPTGTESASGLGLDIVYAPHTSGHLRIHIIRLKFAPLPTEEQWRCAIKGSCGTTCSGPGLHFKNIFFRVRLLPSGPWATTTLQKVTAAQHAALKAGSAVDWDEELSLAVDTKCWMALQSMSDPAIQVSMFDNGDVLPKVGTNLRNCLGECVLPILPNLYSASHEPRCAHLVDPQHGQAVISLDLSLAFVNDHALSSAFLRVENVLEGEDSPQSKKQGATEEAIGAQLARLKQLFYSLDKDRSGAVSLDEIICALHLPKYRSDSISGSGLPLHEIENLFHHMDTDNDGSVSWGEWVSFLETFARGAENGANISEMLQRAQAISDNSTTIVPPHGSKNETAPIPPIPKSRHSPTPRSKQLALVGVATKFKKTTRKARSLRGTTDETLPVAPFGGSDFYGQLIKKETGTDKEGLEQEIQRLKKEVLQLKRQAREMATQHQIVHQRTMRGAAAQTALAQAAIATAVSSPNSALRVEEEKSPMEELLHLRSVNEVLREQLRRTGAALALAKEGENRALTVLQASSEALQAKSNVPHSSVKDPQNLQPMLTASALALAKSEKAVALALNEAHTARAEAASGRRRADRYRIELDRITKSMEEANSRAMVAEQELKRAREQIKVLKVAQAMQEGEDTTISLLAEQQKKLNESRLESLRQERAAAVSAVLVLQRMMRGFLVRHQTEDHRRARERAKVALCLLAKRWQYKRQRDACRKAAVTIQRVQRGRQCREILQSAAVGFTLFQALVRGWHCRRQWMKQLDHHRSERIAASTKVQSAWRMHINRQQYLSIRCSAILIQSQARKRHALRELAARRRALVVLQRAGRCYAARARRLRAAVVLQTCIRAWLKRRWQTQAAAATCVQARARGHLARRKWVPILNVYLGGRIAAAAIIQRNIRMHIANRKYVSLRNATILIQCYERRRRAVAQTEKRRHLKKLSLLQGLAAILLQRHMRSFLARRRVFGMKKKVRESSAALVIQRTFRGFLAREDVVSMREQAQNVKEDEAASAIQRGFRCFLAREDVAAMREEAEATKEDQAAIEIQRVFRGFLAREDAAAIVEETRQAAREDQAAVVIQRITRDFLSKLECASEGGRRQNEAAIAIQKVFRGWLAREDYLDILEGV